MNGVTTSTSDGDNTTRHRQRHKKKCNNPNPLFTSQFIYTIECKTKQRTWAYVSIILPKKRSNTTTRYWYCDPSMMILKKRKKKLNGQGQEQYIDTNEIDDNNHGDDDGDDGWELGTAALHGISRRCDVEIFLDPLYEYCIIPLSCTVACPSSSNYYNNDDSNNDDSNSRHTFRLTTYSSLPLKIAYSCYNECSADVVAGTTCKTNTITTSPIGSDTDPSPSLSISLRDKNILTCLHRYLLRDERKLLYKIGRPSSSSSYDSNGLLTIVHGTGCIYFLGINGSYEHYISIRITIGNDNECGSNSSASASSSSSTWCLSFGKNNDTMDIPPRKQKILLVVSATGKSSYSSSFNNSSNRSNSNNLELSFRYVSDIVPARAGGCNNHKTLSRTKTTMTTTAPTATAAAAGRNRISDQVTFGSAIELTMIGDLLSTSSSVAGASIKEDVTSSSCCKGTDTLDIYSWISQLGTSSL